MSGVFRSIDPPPPHRYGPPGSRGIRTRWRRCRRRPVAGLQGTDYSEKCAELGLEALEARRKNEDMVLVHKYMAQQNESELFVKTGHARAQTRQTRQTAGKHGLARSGHSVSKERPSEVLLCSKVCGTMEQATRKCESFPER